MPIFSAFLLPLPNAMVLPEGMTFFRVDDPEIPVVVAMDADTWDMPDGHDVSVRFFLFETQEEPYGIDVNAWEYLNALLIPEDERRLSGVKRVDGCQSVALAVARVLDGDGDLSPVFDRCLEWTRCICAVWRHAAASHVLLPEYDSLPAVISSATYDGDLKVFTPGHLVLRVGMPGAAAGFPGEPEEFAQRFANMFLGLHMKHPGGVYQDRVLEARSCLFRHGQRDNSVVLASAAVETLVNTTLTTLAWESGLSSAEAAQKYFKGQGLRTRVRVHLSDLLSGDWDPSGSGAVAQWDKRLAELRHRVVHEGYLPTRAEAVAALEALNSFERHVIERVAANAGRYPMTATLVAAREGLERHDAYTEEFRQWLEENWDEDTLDSYLQWCDEVYASRRGL
jgi:hypothetical protein